MTTPHKITPRTKSLAPASRPAETATGVTATIAAAIAALVGITDPAQIAALLVIVGWLPYGVTWLVTLLKKP